MPIIQDVMTKNVITIRANVSITDAMKIMHEQRLRNLIVERENDDDAYGVITEADIVYKVAAYGIDPTEITVAEVMTKPCIEVDPEMSVEEVARLFANHQIHRAPVIGKKLEGIITVFDIVRETMWWQ